METLIGAAPKAKLPAGLHSVQNSGSKMLFKLGIEEPKTLRERIYFSLREAITNNNLVPGRRLFENKIARDFNVSVTPVRESILQLSTEGFLELKTYKNVVVKEISL